MFQGGAVKLCCRVQKNKFPVLTYKTFVNVYTFGAETKSSLINKRSGDCATKVFRTRVLHYEYTLFAWVNKR